MRTIVLLLSLTILTASTALAQAISALGASTTTRVCACGCGRPISPAHTYARGACRTRAFRRRHRPGVTNPGTATPTE